MQEQVQKEPQTASSAPEEIEIAIREDEGLDQVLADIDDVLQANALSFVQNFKQEGGQ